MSQTKMLSARIPAELYAEIDDLRQARGYDRTRWIVEALKAVVASEQRKQVTPDPKP